MSYFKTNYAMNCHQLSINNMFTGSMRLHSIELKAIYQKKDNSILFYNNLF